MPPAAVKRTRWLRAVLAGRLVAVAAAVVAPVKEPPTTRRLFG